MKKGYFKVVFLTVAAIIFIFVGFNNKDATGSQTLVGEILMIVGGGILGFLLEEFLAFAEETDLFLIIPILLNWNKNIHKRGIIINAITIPLLTAATIAGIPLAIPFLIEELASAFINFQCINIQNYNIYRFQEREDTFKKMEARRMANNMQKHGEAAKVISKAMEKTEDIPTMKQIIEGIETKEQLEQLRSLVQATLAANQAANKNRGGK